MPANQEFNYEMESNERRTKKIGESWHLFRDTHSLKKKKYDRNWHFTLAEIKISVPSCVCFEYICDCEIELRDTGIKTYIYAAKCIYMNNHIIYKWMWRILFWYVCMNVEERKIVIAYNIACLERTYMNSLLFKSKERKIINILHIWNEILLKFEYIRIGFIFLHCAEGLKIVSNRIQSELRKILIFKLNWASHCEHMCPDDVIEWDTTRGEMKRQKPVVFKIKWKIISYSQQEWHFNLSRCMSFNQPM